MLCLLHEGVDLTYRCFATQDKAKADIIAKQLKKKAKKRKASKSVGGSGLSSVPSQTRKAVSFA